MHSSKHPEIKSRNRSINWLTTGRITGRKSFYNASWLDSDNQNNIWATDVGLHQVFKFTHKGTLLFQIGEAGVSGLDSLHFDMPADVAVCDDGSFYVSDGYGNSRVVKFFKTGEYLFEWGRRELVRANLIHRMQSA